MIKLSKFKIGILIVIISIIGYLIFKKSQKPLPITPPVSPSTPEKIVLEKMTFLPGIHLPGNGFLEGDSDDKINTNTYTYGQQLVSFEGGPSISAMCSQMCNSIDECKMFVCSKNQKDLNSDVITGNCYLMKNLYLDKYKQYLKNPKTTDSELSQIKNSLYDSGYKS